LLSHFSKRIDYANKERVEREGGNKKRQISKFGIFDNLMRWVNFHSDR
jgi:hypothetical protein